MCVGEEEAELGPFEVLSLITFLQTQGRFIPRDRMVEAGFRFCFISRGSQDHVSSFCLYM